MGAFVILDQVEPLLLNATLSISLVHLGGVVGSIHNRIRSAVKTLLVPLRAITSLPALTADVAELGLALTSCRYRQRRLEEEWPRWQLTDVITPLLQLNNPLADFALLPAILSRKLQNLLRYGVAWADSMMKWSFAMDTGSLTAFGAPCYIPCDE
jgi:hypothetical protein